MTAVSLLGYANVLRLPAPLARRSFGLCIERLAGDQLVDGVRKLRRQRAGRRTVGTGPWRRRGRSRGEHLHPPGSLIAAGETCERRLVAQHERAAVEAAAGAKADTDLHRRIGRLAAG